MEAYKILLKKNRFIREYGTSSLVHQYPSVSPNTIAKQDMHLYNWRDVVMVNDRIKLFIISKPFNQIVSQPSFCVYKYWANDHKNSPYGRSRICSPRKTPQSALCPHEIFHLKVRKGGELGSGRRWKGCKDFPYSKIVLFSLKKKKKFSQAIYSHL